ncbi:uncharacterized protein LTR77_004873 [Saxophila tyrrhenica]|uniref:NmrA-like domain-containing protein n=1 Tax=Saxophila tyrrhenica TaxID=1690608 RepID=A0AAV9PAF2_9PEZI|nr:hypothetical protein LTR77_004873 [Saxophila tyrrhenica]
MASQRLRDLHLKQEMSQKYAADQPAGFNNQVTKVAIVGATGSVGEYITKHLLATGKHKVTAITREDSKSTMPSGVNVAKINYDQPESIAKALQGQQSLIITMKTGQIEPTKKLVAAAAKANVPWVVPNEYSPDLVADPKMGNETGLLPAIVPIREAIRDHCVSSYVGLFCGYWYEYSLANAPQCYGFDFKNKIATFLDDGLTKINTSTWEQCGRAMASLFSLPQYPQDANDKSVTISRWANDAVRVESFFVNQRDMLDSILRVTGEKESDWTIKYQPAQERWQEACEMMKEGGSKAGQGYIQKMYSRVFYKDGSGDFTDKLDNERLGLPKESLDEATKRALEMVEGGYNYFARG